MAFDERYARNFETLTPAEQTALGKSAVAVIGLGGLGGGVVEMLARTGVGTLCVVDGDAFDVSNLNRQLLSTEAGLGVPKARAAVERVRAVNSSVTVRPFYQFLTSENSGEVLEGMDLVVDCLDSIDDRFMLQTLARRHGIPLVSGAIAGTSGQVTVIYPEDAGFELIYGSPDARPEKKRGAEQRLGNLSCCAMMVAAVQVSEVIKVLLGRGRSLRNQLLIMDLMGNTFDVMQLK